MRRAGRAGFKVWVVSDLHLEALPYPDHYELDAPEAFDALVVAGDVNEGCAAKAHDLVARLARGRPAFVVMGNHDPRGQSVAAWTRDMSAACRKGGGAVRLLARDVVHVAAGDGRSVAFAGATLWTDYALHAPSGILEGRSGEPIRGEGGRRTGTPDIERREILEMHRRDRAWLRALRAGDFEGPLVVATHHAPHPACCSSVGLAALEASDMRTEIAGIGACAWVHGHVHASRDFPASRHPGATRIVANPAGPHACNPGFEEDLTIGIDL